MTQKKDVKILFLDIEGVVATHRCHFAKMERSDVCEYDPVIVDFIDSLCTKYKYFIVITSKLTKKFSEKDWFQSRMIQNGGSNLSDFLMCDDDLWRLTNTKMECKAFEIDDWFAAFQKEYGDTHRITDYLIIDDSDIGDKVSQHQKHTVIVENSQDGMCVKDFRNVMKLVLDSSTD